MSSYIDRAVIEKLAGDLLLGLRFVKLLILPTCLYLIMLLHVYCKLTVSCTDTVDTYS